VPSNPEGFGPGALHNPPYIIFTHLGLIIEPDRRTAKMKKYLLGAVIFVAVLILSSSTIRRILFSLVGLLLSPAGEQQ